MKKILLFLITPMVFCFCSSSDDDPVDNDITMKDGDGNIYTEVSIGEQVWLKEDLRTTKLVDGKEIRFVEDWHSMDPISTEYTQYNGAYFYNSYLSRICPKGYEVPEEEDWNKLIDFFGGKDMGKEKVIELINKLGLATGSVSGFNEGSAIYLSRNVKIVYFRTTDGSIGFNSAIGPNRIRCIKQ